jgi:hypothetical protein
MSTNPLAIQNLSRQLLDFEMTRSKPSVDASAMVRVCEKMRGKFSKFMGVIGFSSLLSRALVLAKADVPLLSGVQVRADGTFEGLNEIEQNSDSAAVENAGIVLLTQFLGMLVLFIGETLTLRLVRDVWPDASMDKTYTVSKEGTHDHTR